MANAQQSLRLRKMRLVNRPTTCPFPAEPGLEKILNLGSYGDPLPSS